MVASTPVFIAFLLSISRAQLLPSSDPSYFIISTVPEDTSDDNVGYLSSTGTIISDPFDYKDIVYSISSNGTLVSSSSNGDNPILLGVVGGKPDVPNVLLATTPVNEAAECAPITTEWSIVNGTDGYESLSWKNSEFPDIDAYFCITNDGATGGLLYAVFTAPPGERCVNVTLEPVH